MPDHKLHAQQGCCDHNAVWSQDESHHPQQDEKNRQSMPPSFSSSLRFSWTIVGMDCPSCAKKIEKSVIMLPDVDKVTVLFASEKLIVYAKNDVSDAVSAAVKRLGFTLRGNNAHADVSARAPLPKFLTLLLLSTLMLCCWILHFFNPKLSLLAFTLTTIVGLIPVAKKAGRQILSGSPFSIETLMTLAAIGAMCIGATTESAVVLLLFLLGEQLEAYAAQRARRGIQSLVALIPNDAILIKNNQRKRVSVLTLRPGDVIEIAPGGRLPADAELLDPFASFDESALTGEFVPVDRQQGEQVAAGSLAVQHTVQMRVISEPGNNAIDRLLSMIEEAEAHRAPIERFIDHFSRYYTPTIILLALAVILLSPSVAGLSWQDSVYRGLTLLLIACPCALVISTPAAITSGLAAAARRGILIKGGAVLEQLRQIDRVAFDKTGTLTEGNPSVTDVIPSAGVSKHSLLMLAAAVEIGSHHPLAKAIVEEATHLDELLPIAKNRKALPGVGIEGEINGKTILVTAPSKLTQQQINSEWNDHILTLERAGKTVVMVLEAGVPVGVLALRDTLRHDAKHTVDALNTLGIRGVMLTGDSPRVAAAIAHELNLDYRAGLLPSDKVAAITELSIHHKVAMIGDGINDAPAMKAAYIGIAMGSGTDVALEAADVTLPQNRLSNITEMITLARRTHLNICQNMVIALGLKSVLLLTSLLGITGLWLAVLADSGATVLVTANALRLLNRRS